MSMPWFFEDVPFDDAAAETAVVACGVTATALERASLDRWRRALLGLARCSGPYATDLSAALLRTCGRDLELAEGCRALAGQLRKAAVDAAAEEGRRLVLRDTYESELAQDRAAADAAARRAATAGSVGVTAA